MTERWTDERLDRFAASVETAIAAHNDRLSQVEQDRTELQRSFRGMTQAMDALARTQIEILQRIDETQAEVRGLQTENRRILDHLFGQEES